MSPSPPWAAHKPRSPRACTAHATAAPRVAGSGGPIVKKVRKKHPSAPFLPYFHPRMAFFGRNIAPSPFSRPEMGSLGPV